MTVGVGGGGVRASLQVMNPAVHESLTTES
jgi:hypothetical protein